MLAIAFTLGYKNWEDQQLGREQKMTTKTDKELLDKIEALKAENRRLKLENEKLTRWDNTEFPVVFTLRGLRITVSDNRLPSHVKA